MTRAMDVKGVIGERLTTRDPYPRSCCPRVRARDPMKRGGLAALGEAIFFAGKVTNLSPEFLNLFKISHQ
jgi:hypothetical protein